ncbi:MAG: family 16 glycoside hydrolase [Verrucomicrobiota bacterium]
MRLFFVILAVLAVGRVRGSDVVFDFGKEAGDQPPPGFRSAVAGMGKPGDWKVILDEVAPLLAPLTSKAMVVSKQAVLAQLARSGLPDHYPILVYTNEDFGDFKFTTRFKCVGGALEQMGGVVFRFQNESNFSVVRASVLGGNFRCYRVVDGELKPPIGPDIVVSKGEWHELSVECEGNRITCALDGKDLIRLIDSAGPKAGKIGFWTKSDAVTYFRDARVRFTHEEAPAQRLIASVMKEFPRLLGLAIYTVEKPGSTPVVIASTDPGEVGRAGTEVEKDVIARGTRYWARGKSWVTITAPLTDRNGESIAAICVKMKSFAGQTEDNARARANPVIERMQAGVQSLDDLVR